MANDPPRASPTTRDQVAAWLDGSEHNPDGPWDTMAAANLVAIFGLSDDLIEIRGASTAEIDAFQGLFREGERQDLRFTEAGLVDDHTPAEDQDGEYIPLSEPPPGCARVDVVVGADGLFWSFRTDIPHATFLTTLHGTPFCRGIVISLDDLG